jgi:hypothetical protein
MKISRKLARAALTLALGMMAGGVLGERTDTNTVPYAESFEGTAGGLWGNGMPVATTNGWYSGENDLSHITNLTYTPPSISAPLKDAEHTRFLRLQTEGDTLTNKLANASFAGGDIWVDTLVQFVVGEDLPNLAGDNNIKMAAMVWAQENGSTNLVVYHGTWDLENSCWGDPHFAVIDGDFDPSLWYRLTVQLQSIESLDGNAEAFRVLLNGQDVTSTNAYDAGWAEVYQNSAPTGGVWFLSAGCGGASATRIDSLCFQGTGGIDDLVVTRSEPTFEEELTPYQQYVALFGVDATDEDALDFETEFLLNTDPTAATAFSFKITVIEASAGSDVAVTVELERDTVVSEINGGNINGTLCLYGTDDLSEPFTEIAGTDVTGTDFGAEDNTHTYLFEGLDGGAKFFKAVIK